MNVSKEISPFRAPWLKRMGIGLVLLVLVSACATAEAEPPSTTATTPSTPSTLRTMAEATELGQTICGAYEAGELRDLVEFTLDPPRSLEATNEHLLMMAHAIFGWCEEEFGDYLMDVEAEYPASTYFVVSNFISQLGLTEEQASTLFDEILTEEQAAVLSGETQEEESPSPTMSAAEGDALGRTICDAFEPGSLRDVITFTLGSGSTPEAAVDGLILTGQGIILYCPEELDAYLIDLEAQFAAVADDVIDTMIQDMELTEEQAQDLFGRS